MEIKLGVILKQLLKERDITVAQLSRATGVPNQTLSNWLTGLEPRSFKQIKNIANYFEVTVDYLVYGVGKLPSPSNLLAKHDDEITAGVYEVVLRKIRHQK